MTESSKDKKCLGFFVCFCWLIFDYFWLVGFFLLGLVVCFSVLFWSGFLNVCHNQHHGKMKPNPLYELVLKHSDTISA